MRLVLPSILLGMSLLTLTACQPPEPTVFGMPQSQWSQLTPAQQQLVIEGYNQRQATQVANEPVMSAIQTANQIANTALQENHPQHHANPSASFPPPNPPHSFPSFPQPPKPMPPPQLF